MKIQSGVDLHDLQQRIGVGKNEELRESEKRRRYLEGFARLITPARPSLQMHESIPTAAVNQEGDEPVILMATQAFEQPATKYSRRVFDLIMQEALTVHEIGHILYTDMENFKTVLGDVDLEKGHKGMFKEIWNALEDAAIEEQLRHDLDVAGEILVMNANLFEKDNIGQVVGDDESEEAQRTRFSVFQAVQLGILEMGVYDGGNFARLRDPDDETFGMTSENDTEIIEKLTPEMKAVVKDVKSLPESSDRNRRIYEFWEVLEEYLEDADVSGENEAGLSQLLSDDGTIGTGSGDGGEGDDGDASPVDGKPDDSKNQFSGEVRPASELGRGSVSQQVEVQVELAAGDDAEDVGAADDVGDGDRLNAPEDTESPGGEDGEDGEEGEGAISEEMEQLYQQELSQEAAALDGGEALLNEVEEFLNIVNEAEEGEGGNTGAPGFRGLSMELPTEEEYDGEMWDSVQRRGRRIARILKNRLSESQQNNVLRNQRRGKLTRRNMMRAERGDLNIFERPDDSEKKEYDAILVLDRSGSMSGQKVRYAELAIGSLVYAFEQIGINVCVMDLLSSQARLTHAFGQKIDQTRGNLLSSKTSGGTPLAQVIHLARKRVQEQDTNPFMVVVTDGEPANRSKYIAELENCTFPVLGVYVSDSSQRRRHGDESYFHRQVYLTDRSQLQTSIVHLAEEVIDASLIDLSHGVNF